MTKQATNFSNTYPFILLDGAIVILTAGNDLKISDRVGEDHKGRVTKDSDFFIGVALEDKSAGEALYVYVAKPVIIKQRFQDGPYLKKYEDLAVVPDDSEKYIPEFSAGKLKKTICYGLAIPLKDDWVHLLT